MNTRLTENQLLYNELIESKPINAISNGGMREKVEEFYKRNYYHSIIFSQVWKYSKNYKDTNRCSYTLENTENKKN